MAEEMGEILSRAYGSKGETAKIDQLPTISPISRVVGRCPMATSFRELIAANDSPNSGEYRRRGACDGMARKMGNR